MRLRSLFPVLLGTILSGAASAENLKEDALGTWSLTSYVSTAADGSKTENFGPSPKGVAVFDRSGHFSITIVRGDLPAFASGNREKGTAEENGAVVRGSIAYFGTFVLDPSGRDFVLKIEGATLPNWRGATQKRGVAMGAPDQLTLINAGASGGGSAEVKWIRAK